MTDTTNPTAVFEGAIAALNAEDWQAAAELCDPVSLRTFRRRLLEQCAPSRLRPMVTVEQMLASSPGMPREVAEYEVNEVRRYADPVARMREELPSVSSLEELHELSPVATYAAWLDGRSARRQVERLVESGHMSARAAADTVWRMVEPLRYVALGAIRDGDRIVHVLYRFATDDSGEWVEQLSEVMADVPADEREFIRERSSRGHPYVATCRRQPDGTWALVADHIFLGVGSTMFTQLPDDEGDSGDSD